MIKTPNKYYKTLIIAICLFSVINYNKPNKNSLDQKVYQDVFQKLIEKTILDYRKFPVIPLPPKNDSKTELIKMEKKFKKATEKHQKHIDTIAFVPLIIFINDTLRKIPKRGLIQLKSYNVKFIDTLSVKSNLKINLNSIFINEKYTLKYKSSLKESLKKIKREDLRKEKHVQQVSGILNLSRIYYNKEETVGVFSASFKCGTLCGCNYIIIVKKQNKKWFIGKVRNIGCA